jgi:hypothetical protein
MLALPLPLALLRPTAPVQVARLLSRHAAEMAAARSSAAQEARAQLDGYVAQTEAAVRQVGRARRGCG